MISGIGTDIVEIDRIRDSIRKNSAFKKLVFHQNEITYCETKARPEESYAARFAAKESFFKALGTGWAGGTSFTEVSIENDEKGKPILHLFGETKKSFEDIGKFNVHVSMSHSKQYATAVVVIESR